MTESHSKEPKTSTGTQPFLPEAWVYRRGVLLGGKGSFGLSCCSLRWWHWSRPLLFRWKLLSQPGSYRRNHSSQPLQFTVHCHKLNHQRKVIQQAGNSRGRGPGRYLCLSPLPLWKQRLIPSPPREDLAQFGCQSPKQLAGGHAGNVCQHRS